VFGKEQRVASTLQSGARYAVKISLGTSYQITQPPHWEALGGGNTAEPSIATALKQS